MDERVGNEVAPYEATSVFSFEGRITARRFVILTLAPYAFMALTAIVSSRTGQVRTGGGVSGVFTALSALAAAWISFATHAKRWHDLGKSGYRALLQLLPLVNFIAWLHLALTKGQSGPNTYGAPPQD